MTAEAEDRGFDRFRVEGDLTEIVAQEWTDRHQDMTLNGEKYRFAYLEEVPGADPHEIFILRVSDGKLFECDLWVNVYDSGHAQPTAPGQRARAPSEQVQVTAQAPDGAEGTVL